MINYNKLTIILINYKNLKLIKIKFYHLIYTVVMNESDKKFFKKS